MGGLSYDNQEGYASTLSGTRLEQLLMDEGVMWLSWAVPDEIRVHFSLAVKLLKPSHGKIKQRLDLTIHGSTRTWYKL
jgi:hypothetical protein